MNASFAVQLASRLGERAVLHLASLCRAPQQVRMGYLVRREQFFQPFEVEKLDVVQLGPRRAAVARVSSSTGRHYHRPLAQSLSKLIAQQVKAAHIHRRPRPASGERRQRSPLCR